MSKHRKKRVRKTGLPPGTLVHVGERRTEKVRISALEFNEEQVHERELGDLTSCPVLPGRPTVTWIQVNGMHEVGIIERLGNCLGLHDLALEDVVNTEHHPKLEDFGESLFIILKMLDYREESQEIAVEQVSLIIGPNYLLSFEEGGRDLFQAVRERVKNGKGRIRRSGPDYLAYTLIDMVVDHYFLVEDRLSERLDRLEEDLVANPSRETLQNLYRMKREVMKMRRAVWPLREAISGLRAGESPLVAEPTRLYLNDVHDHIFRVIEAIEMFREAIADLLNAYLSSMSNRMNEVMKVLTIIATLFIPLTFIVGVYGMNFEHLPELRWRWGYPLVWLVMLATAGGMLVYFWRKKWF